MSKAFTITEKQVTGRKGIMGRPLPDKTRFIVIYKGVEVNAFPSEAAATQCADELNSMRPDALPAFEDAVREMGFAIPA